MKTPKNNDFLEFIESKKNKPPQHLNTAVLRFVKNEINPSHKVVFVKLLTIQALIGFLTLLFCPQFSLSLTNNYELFHYFHRNFGEVVCMSICGAIFIGTGAIFAAYLLKPLEIKKIKKSVSLYYFSISLIALSAFILFGANTYLHLSVYWFLGAMISGLLLFETNRIIKIKFLSYHHAL